MNPLPVLILVNRSASAFAYSCRLTKESDRKGRWQIINLTHKRDVCSWHLCMAQRAYICLCECECVPGCSFASLNVTMCACSWFWGQSKGCYRTCSLGSKTSTLPPAISLSGSNLPMSVCRSLSLCSIALTCTCGTSSRLAPTLGPHSVFLRFIAPALNFCKQLTQPAPVLQAAGKDST